MKNFTKIATLGVVGGIALGLSAVVLPAQAVPELVTTYTASPTTVRSGEGRTFTTNGSVDTSKDWTFVGCYVYWLDGAQFNNTINGAFFPVEGTIVQENYAGVDFVFRAAGYANQACVPGGVPATPATFDTGDLITTPQVAIDPVVLEVGKAITATSFPYSYEATGGSSPFDWATGGVFTEADADSCNNVALPSITTALPDGVTIDDTYSANGEAPNLVLDGTPSTVGTYDVCVELEGDADGVAYAWMTIMVEEPKLPATGLDSAVIATAAGGAGIVAAAGLFLVAMRRRRSS